MMAFFCAEEDDNINIKCLYLNMRTIFLCMQKVIMQKDLRNIVSPHCARHSWNLIKIREQYRAPY